MRLNQHLENLEHHLRAVGHQESARLNARVANLNNPLDDYEIDATLYFIMREDDPNFDDGDDKQQAFRRRGSLKCVGTA